MAVNYQALDQGLCRRWKEIRVNAFPLNSVSIQLEVLLNTSKLRLEQNQPDKWANKMRSNRSTEEQILQSSLIGIEIFYD